MEKEKQLCELSIDSHACFISSSPSLSHHTHFHSSLRVLVPCPASSQVPRPRLSSRWDDKCQSRHVTEPEIREVFDTSPIETKAEELRTVFDGINEKVQNAISKQHHWIPFCLKTIIQDWQ